MDEEQLYEFPVYIEDKNEIITLFLSKKAMERVTQDEAFLTQLIAKETKQQQINEIPVAPEHTDKENAVDKNNAVEGICMARQSSTFVIGNVPRKRRRFLYWIKT
ncbi:PREDICTED: uncharacterized protein LOC108764565 isoform X2 [Trachymyrmex cornetzi]|uniref:uncharacterized protein LOC108764565 isoform X2 n=1 Tax=Trachymyrmex cornetzi TaxID=471704 RepID=UPI00084F5578|nr:PREDICTED: uncharacterized protein LOC108764565 isoform X2 [Trachymyrmex cornetzi]